MNITPIHTSDQSWLKNMVFIFRVLIAYVEADFKLIGLGEHLFNNNTISSCYGETNTIYALRFGNSLYSIIIPSFLSLTFSYPLAC